MYVELLFSALFTLFVINFFTCLIMCKMFICKKVGSLKHDEWVFVVTPVTDMTVNKAVGTLLALYIAKE